MFSAAIQRSKAYAALISYAFPNDGYAPMAAEV
jgi:hypothetical protein